MGQVVEELAARIVAALIKRAEQDAGLSVEQVQQLLLLRVKADAEKNGLAPRVLMAAVWRVWEQHDRPPMLGEQESERIVDGLVRKGILTRGRSADGAAVVGWGGLSGREVERRLPALNHDERLFVLGILRLLRRTSRSRT